MSPAATTSAAPASRGTSYRPRDSSDTPLSRLMRDHLETFLANHEQRHREHYGHLRPEVRRTLEELIECGDPHFGVARVRCLDCGDETFVPLSCRLRGTCPSCHAKRQLVFGEYVLEEVLPDVACRQWTFSLPKALRVFFRYDGTLFKELSQIVVRELTRYIRQATGHMDLEPGFVTVDQTFGTLPDDFHPHLHVAATDGGFTADGAFVRLSRVRKKDVAAIEQVLRHAVLRRLVRLGKISADFCDLMLSWEHSGFSLHASKPIPAGRRDRLDTLLNYAARHPFNPQRITYNANTGKVIYKANRTHGRRKTNTVEAHAVDFIAMLAQHIPHRRRHQFRHYGAANAKVRARLGITGEPIEPAPPKVTAARGRRSWARMIWRLTGVDPLVCPKCGGQRVILSVIFDDASLVRICTHLGLPSQPPSQAPARDPPPLPAADRDARVSVTVPTEEDDLLLVDLDTDRWDAIDEPQESDQWEDSDATCQPDEDRDEQRKPQSLLEVMNRWPGMVRWADEPSEDREQQSKPTIPGI